MIQPRKWWIGLPLLAVLFVLAATLNTETIEKDIAERARAALAQDPRALDNAQIAVAGRDVSVSGVALSKGAAAKLVESVEQQPGVRAVIDETSAPPLVKPFVFVLERKGGKLALSGNAPVTGERDRIRAAAASKGLEAADTAAYADGAPNNFEALANYGLALLAELEDGKVTVADTALSVSGVAKTSGVYERILAALKSPPADAVVAAVDIQPPPVSPFVWSAAKTGDAVTISGFVPSGKIRDAIAAKSAALDLKDETRIASGAPSGDFAGAAVLALNELAKLTQGKVVLSDARLSIEGAGKQNVTASAMEASARAALPQGFLLGPIDVAAGAVSPYVFTARKDGAALTLAGYAPTADAHASLVEGVKRGFGGKIVDGIIVADGAPRGFVDAATASLRALARLSSGAVALSDHEIALQGVAFHEKAPPDIEARLTASLPEGFESSARLGVEPIGETIEPARLFGRLSEIVAKGISFSADNSSIGAESLPVLDALASTLLRSPDAAIEIAGHTDNSGSEADNEAVSKRRAQVVLDYLTKAGVDPARLTATGYGGSRPIAANDSESGRAENRRIEFSIK